MASSTGGKRENKNAKVETLMLTSLFWPCSSRSFAIRSPSVGILLSSTGVSAVCVDAIEVVAIALFKLLKKDEQTIFIASANKIKQKKKNFGSGE